MSILTAKNSFRNGLMALVDSKYTEAAECFHSAMTVDKDRGKGRNWVRYLSYYAYSRACCGKTPRESVELCERAVRLSRYDPDVLLNMGRVYASAGKISQALRAFQAGLEISPNHKHLQKELALYNRRSSPPLSFLDRNHLASKVLGKLVNARPQRPRSNRIPT